MKREILFDNAKGLAIISVILGHLLTNVTYNIPAKVYYLLINSFHIPVFVLISGIFSRTEISYNDIAKFVKRILIPFLIFDIFYELFHLVLYKQISPFILSLAPYWLMWYMLALFTWRMLLPVFNSFKYSIIISIFITVFLGYFSGLGELFNISKTFFFFPFFLTGYYLSRDFFKNKKLNPFLAVIIILFSCLIYIYLNKIHIGWVLGNFSYSEMGVNQWYAGIFRIAFFIFAFFLSRAVISLIPEKRNILTKIGEKSLYVYLWHGFIVAVFKKFKVVEFLIDNFNVYPVLIFLTFLSVIIAYILSLSCISNLTEEIFNNTYKDLLKS